MDSGVIKEFTLRLKLTVSSCSSICVVLWPLLKVATRGADDR